MRRGIEIFIWVSVIFAFFLAHEPFFDECLHLRRGIAERRQLRKLNAVALGNERKYLLLRRGCSRREKLASVGILTGVYHGNIRACRLADEKLRAERALAKKRAEKHSAVGSESLFRLLRSDTLATRCHIIEYKARFRIELRLRRIIVYEKKLIRA